MVVTAPATFPAATAQERVATPSISTVQAPQTPIPQPYLVPVRPSSSRKTQSSGIASSTSTVCAAPFTVSLTTVQIPPPNSIGQRRKDAAPRTPYLAKRKRAVKANRFTQPARPGVTNVASLYAVPGIQTSAPVMAFPPPQRRRALEDPVVFLSRSAHRRIAGDDQGLGLTQKAINPTLRSLRPNSIIARIWCACRVRPARYGRAVARSRRGKAHGLFTS